jgi:hypothetical protein
MGKRKSWLRSCRRLDVAAVFPPFRVLRESLTRYVFETVSKEGTVALLPFLFRSSQNGVSEMGRFLSLRGLEVA